MVKPKPLILIVDDNPSNLILLEDLLSNLYRIKSFYEPRELLEKVKEEEPVSAILSDLMMPGMSGLELLTKVKTLKPHIPFFIISAFDRKQDITAAYKNGAYRYIVKPIDINSLLEDLEKVIEYSQSND
jgi:CheY-like chemotaxis protein